MSRIGITITDEWTIARLKAYKETQKLDYADVVRLALRGKLPALQGVGP